MMKSTNRRRVATLFAASVLGAGIVRAETNVADKALAAEIKPSVYFVESYDPKRDPAKDLVAAVKLATEQKKHILLQVGGDWCGWCHAMSKYFTETASVRQVLQANFVVVKINFSDDNRNEGFLASLPKVAAFPHLFVLDGTGKVLHSQYTGDLEKGSSYDEKIVLDFLNQWTPAAVKAKAPPSPAPEHADAPRN